MWVRGETVSGRAEEGGRGEGREARGGERAAAGQGVGAQDSSSLVVGMSCMPGVALHLGMGGMLQALLVQRPPRVWGVGMLRPGKAKGRGPGWPVHGWPDRDHRDPARAERGRRSRRVSDVRWIDRLSRFAISCVMRDLGILYRLSTKLIDYLPLVGRA